MGALGATVTAMDGGARGLGIPLGGGAVVHADLSVEPVRKALVEIALVGGELRRALLLLPGDAPGVTRAILVHPGPPPLVSRTALRGGPGPPPQR